ncbi:DMT family transporter [Peribacillus sp. SCS-155]|uniref:DMT family transporter n=1 Tax=Peribacillus sedimenti TaxID=3115297 RepID=UPI0039059F72
MRSLYIFLLLLTSLLWGANFVVGKSLVNHASPLTLTTLRWLIAVIFLLPFVWWREKRFFPPKDSILPLVLMGITGVVLFNLFQFKALELTSSANVGLISTLNTISIAAFSFLILKERLNLIQILCVVISLSGVMVVLSKGDVGSLMMLELNSGDLYMVMAVCIWGIYSVCSKWALTKTSAIMATLYSGIFGLLILIPFNLHTFSVNNLDASFVQSILYTGVISTLLCTVFWNIGVSKLGASFAGIFLNFNPVFTAILAFLLLGEKMTVIQIAGSTIVVAGCLLFSQAKTNIFKRSEDQQMHRSHAG